MPLVKKLCGDPWVQKVITVAGTIYGSQDGQGSSARFGAASGIAIDQSGVIYVAQHDGPLGKIVIN